MSNDLILAGIDETQLEGLTAEERQQFIQAVKNEMKVSLEGIDIKPSRIKINKDSCTFMDELGNSIKELRGVIVYKDKTRGYWPKGSGNIPECSSIGGVRGTTKDGIERNCASCPFNQWGSGVDESGSATKGKACKEMRRIFIAEKRTAIPSMLSLPPTSINSFDKYISARVAKGIVDVAAEAIFTLRSEKSDSGFKYAVVECHLGDKVSPKDMLAYIQMRDRIQAAANKIGVEADDYMGADSNEIGEDEDPFTK